jgi:hypothetical protein
VPQTWTVTFSAAEVAGLADGTLTARGSYAVGNGSVNGRELQIVKDVVAPGAPDATPPGGTYATPQAVTLDRPDPASVVHYTANGATPTAASPVAPSQLIVSSSQVIRAIAIDAVGNTSPVSAFAYTIGPANGGTGGGTGGSQPPGVAAAGPAPGLGQVLSGVLGTSARSLAVSDLALARRISVSRLRVQGLRVSMRLPAGAATIRYALYRGRDGRRAGRPLATGARLAQAGVYRLTLRSRSLLRTLGPGRYALQVRAGRNASELGGVAAVTFTVTR